MYLEDPKLSFRSKGLLACALRAFPNGSVTVEDFASRYDDPHLNGEYIFRWSVEDLKSKGYLTEVKGYYTFHMFKQEVEEPAPQQ